MTTIPEQDKYYDLVAPDINILKTLLEDADPNKPNDPITVKAIKEKYDSMTYEPNLIEKTMTQEQLFTQGHPLWAKPYTINELTYIMRNMHECTCYEDLESMIEDHKEVIKYLRNQTKN